jgi:hypothetical protein
VNPNQAFTGVYVGCTHAVYAPGRSFCVVCDGKLARGDFASDVPEVRYDRHGTDAEGCGGRYAGLEPHQKFALAEAISQLISLRTLWACRADADDELDEWDIPTSADVAPCCDGACDGTSATCEAWADAHAD